MIFLTDKDLATRIEWSFETLSVDELLIQLYKAVSLGPSALLTGLKSLFNAEHICIQQSRSPQERPFDDCDKGYQIESQTARLSFDGVPESETENKSGLDLSLEMTFVSPEVCQSTLTSDRAQSLIKHIQQALSLAYILQEQRQSQHSVAYVLDHYPLPLCAIDNHLNTVFANQAFKLQFQQTHCQYSAPLNLSSLKALAREEINLISLCKDESEQTALKQALSLAASQVARHSQYLRVKLLTSDCPMVITTSGEVPNLFRHYARDNLVWVYAFNADYAKALRNTPSFKALKLSSAESELSLSLFEGLSLNDIAEQRHVSKQTVRKQLQSVLRKTECDCQEGLIIFLFEHCLQYRLLQNDRLVQNQQMAQYAPITTSTTTLERIEG